MKIITLIKTPVIQIIHLAIVKSCAKRVTSIITIMNPNQVINKVNRPAATMMK